MNDIVFFIGLFILIFGILLSINLRRQYYIASLLRKKADPDLFLKEIEKDIKAARNESMKKHLLVSKSAGLFYKGEWEETLKLLNSISPDSLTKKFKITYYNNKLFFLLLMERFEEAKEVLAEHSDIFKQKTNNKELNDALKSTLATYEFYLGDLEKSREMFMELNDIEGLDIFNAIKHYFLGQISLKEGKEEEGLRHLDHATELGKNTFLPHEIKRLVNS